MSKKILSALLAFVLLISLFPATALTASAAAASGDANAAGTMKWSLSNGVLTFTGTGEIEGADLSTVEGNKDLGWYQAANAPLIQTVVFPKGLTKIGDNLFKAERMTGLSKVVVEDVNSWLGVSISASAENPLLNAHNLAIGTNGSNKPVDTLTIDAAIDIPAAAFSGVTVKHIKIGPKVKSIGTQAFEGCSNLQTVTINGNASIGQKAFMGSAVNSVSINGKGDIGDGAFQACTNLESVSVGGRKNLGTNIFKQCASLSNVKLSDDITTIDAGAFQDCIGLKQIKLPMYLNVIGAAAFNGCTNLGDIVIPSPLREVGADAFGNCNSMHVVYITDMVKWCKIAFANAGANPLSAAHNLFLNNKPVNTLTIPSETTSIGAYAFAGGDKISTVVMNERIRSAGSIGTGAFADSGVQKVIFKDVKQRDALKGAFPGASYEPVDPAVPSNPGKNSCGDHLTWRIQGDELIIEGEGKILDKASWNDFNQWPGENEEEKKANMKAGLAGINQITFVSTTIEEIKDTKAFENLFKVADVNAIWVRNLGKYAQINFNGLALLDKRDLYHNGTLVRVNLEIPYGTSYISANAFKGGSFQNVTIPGTVDRIDASAFEDCADMRKLSIGDGVIAIGDNAFKNCRMLDAITLPDSVKSIGAGTFAKCGNLSDVNLGNGVSNIGAGAFAGDIDLKHFEMPDSVAKIDSGIFSGCTGLEKIKLSRNVQTIPANAFDGCSKLQSIDIPANAHAFGADAFKGCSSLGRVNITNLPGWCEATFANENSNPVNIAKTLYLNGKPLEELTLPNVHNISARAFQGCETLTTLIIPDTIKEIGDYAFEGCTNLKEVVVKKSVWDDLNNGNLNLDKNTPFKTAHFSFQEGPVEPGIGTETFPVSDDLVNMLTKVLPFDWAAKEVNGQWIIGYGTPGQKDQIVTRAEGAAALRSYLERAAGAVHADPMFGGYTIGPKMDALASFTYFNGTSWLGGGSTLYDNVWKHDAKKPDYDIVGAFCAQSRAKSQAQMNLRLMEANLFLTGKYVTSVPANYKWVNLDPNGGISGEGGSLVGYDTNKSAYILGAFDPHWKNNEMEFTGWFTKKEGGTKIVTLDASTSSKTLYAHWQPKGSGVEDGKIVGNPVNYRLPAHFAIAAGRENQDGNGRVRVFKDPISIPEGEDAAALLKKETHISVLEPNDVMTVVAEYRFPDTGRHLWVKLLKSGWVDLGDVPGYSVEFGTVKLEDQKRLPIYPNVAGTELMPDLTATSAQGLRNGDSVTVISRQIIKGEAWGYTVYWDPDAIPKSGSEKVKGEYRSGWVRLAFIEMAGAVEGGEGVPEEDDKVLLARGEIVGPDKVFYRETPDPTKGILGTVPKGTKINIYGYETHIGHKWCLTDYGWICMDYVKETEVDLDKPAAKPEDSSTAGNVGSDDNTKVLASGYVFNNVNLTVRKGPGNGNPRVDELTKGARVHVYQTQMNSGTQWGRIAPEDPRWVSLSYVYGLDCSRQSE